MVLKREKSQPPKAKKYRAKTIKPWFWKECCICGDEMRREPVHRILIDWFEKRCGPDNMCVVRDWGGITDTYYFCNACCPTLSDACKYFERELLPLYRGLR